MYLASVSISTPAFTSWLVFFIGVIIGMIIAIKLR